jgi:CRISPR-associated endoribonuclease Cas6
MLPNEDGMRITLYYKSDNDILLNPNYQSLIQGLIYNNLNKEIGDYVHNYTYNAENNIYKKFTFSNISSNNLEYFKGLKIIKFSKDIWFTVSSSNIELLKSLIVNLKRHNQILLGDNRLKLFQIKIYDSINISSPIKIHMLSPITVYLTNERHTKYYKPEEKEFSELVRSNIIRKYSACNNNKKLDYYDFTIMPVGNNKKIITSYKGTIIEAYMGDYKLSGSPELIQFSYDVGLGSKNSQGFGLWGIASSLT